MKRVESANASSKSSTSRSAQARRQFVVCVDNRGHEVSLEVLKIYLVLPSKRKDRNWLRVIDESGEDYLYPADRFVPIDLPPKVRKVARAVPVT